MFVTKGSLLLRHSSFVIRHFWLGGLLLAFVGVSSCKKVSSLTTSHVDPNGPVEIVIPERGAYTGAFMDFGDAEDDVTLEVIEDFEQMVGKHQAIIASSSHAKSRAG